MKEVARASWPEFFMASMLVSETDARLTTSVSSGVKLVSPRAMYPVSRAVISWRTQPLPSGSLNEANEA
jgi:hypothetical protein